MSNESERRGPRRFDGNGIRQHQSDVGAGAAPDATDPARGQMLIELQHGSGEVTVRSRNLNRLGMYRCLVSALGELAEQDNNPRRGGAEGAQLPKGPKLIVPAGLKLAPGAPPLKVKE